MRIAFVIAALGAGGAERVVALLCRAAIARGWQVTILSFDAPDDDVYHDFSPEVRLRRFNLPMASGIGAGWSTARRVAALRKEFVAADFDIVVSFLTKVNVLTLLATIGLDIPVIVSERNNPLRQDAHPAWNVMLRMLYPRAAAIIMQTEAAKRVLSDAQCRRAVVIPNPVDAATFLPRPTRPTITGVGRLTSQKGFDILIDAFARVADTYPEWHLVIWGEGADREALEKHVAMKQLAHRITLPGTSAKPGSWVETTSLFVLSSRYEGFGNVLAEAMAAGLPVVSANCHFGPADMVINDLNGLLVRPEDAAALADGMKQIMDDPDLGARLGNEAQISMRRLSPEHIAERWFSLASHLVK